MQRVDHLRFFVEDSDLATGQALKGAPQLLVFNARRVSHVSQAQTVDVIEQHQHHRLQHTSVFFSFFFFGGGVFTVDVVHPPSDRCELMAKHEVSGGHV